MVESFDEAFEARVARDQAEMDTFNEKCQREDDFFDLMLDLADANREISRLQKEVASHRRARGVTVAMMEHYRRVGKGAATIEAVTAEILAKMLTTHRAVKVVEAEVTGDGYYHLLIEDSEGHLLSPGYHYTMCVYFDEADQLRLKKWEDV